jgi:hypothetical protein
VELNIKRKQDFLRMQRTAMPEAQELKELKRCAMMRYLEPKRLETALKQLAVNLLQ